MLSDFSLTLLPERQHRFWWFRDDAFLAFRLYLGALFSP